MERRGIFTILLIITIIVVVGIIVWQVNSIINKGTSNVTEEESNLTGSGTNVTLPEGTDANETDGGANETGVNETESSGNETTSDFGANPTGTITSIDHRSDVLGDYICNFNETPGHQIKLYTYKIVGGIKNLSENYIESVKRDDICQSYGNMSEGESFNYYIEWKWDAVENIDGYRVYQYYYRNVNVSRNYNYYAELQTERFIDTGLGLWKKE